MVASTCVAKTTSPHHVVKKKYHLQIGHGEEAHRVKVSLDLVNVFLTEFPLF